MGIYVWIEFWKRGRTHFSYLNYEYYKIYFKIKVCLLVKKNPSVFNLKYFMIIYYVVHRITLKY